VRSRYADPEGVVAGRVAAAETGRMTKGVGLVEAWAAMAASATQRSWDTIHREYCTQRTSLPVQEESDPSAQQSYTHTARIEVVVPSLVSPTS
jgi:hypothetical protein